MAHFGFFAFRWERFGRTLSSCREATEPSPLRVMVHTVLNVMGLVFSLLAATAWAGHSEPASPPLELLAEYPVEGMVGGNLSGLARCGDSWWAVSDREDERIYRLVAEDNEWRAVAEEFSAPSPPDAGLPSFLVLAAKARGILTGQLDLEGISCDDSGNRYLVSESYAAVLKLAVDGSSTWLDLPSSMVAAAREAGLLQRVNALYEGVAVSADGTRLWLAAERQGRGILRVDLDGDGSCAAGCILLAEDKLIRPPPALGPDTRPADFSALALYGDRLFTLERLAHRVCRRDPDSGALERCWSYADAALAESRRYESPYGLAEALWLDDSGVWIGVDNNDLVRVDGEARPTVWHFAAPPGGWLEGVP